MTPKAMIWHGQAMPVASARMPTTTAASPNHRKCTPGNDGLQHEQQHGQDQPVPDPEAEEEGEKPLHVVVLSPTADAAWQTWAQACGTLPWRRAAGRRRRRGRPRRSC